MRGVCRVLVLFDADREKGWWKGTRRTLGWMEGWGCLDLRGSGGDNVNGWSQASAVNECSCPARTARAEHKLPSPHALWFVKLGYDIYFQKSLLFALSLQLCVQPSRSPLLAYRSSATPPCAPWFPLPKECPPERSSAASGAWDPALSDVSLRRRQRREGQVQPRLRSRSADGVPR